jgi:hypothetical protein
VRHLSNGVTNYAQSVRFVKCKVGSSVFLRFRALFRGSLLADSSGSAAVLALLRRESGYGGRTRAASGAPSERTLLAGVLAPSSAAGRSGRACSRTPSTSLIPTGFSRGQAIRVGLTTRIRHAATPTRRARVTSNLQVQRARPTDVIGKRCGTSVAKRRRHQVGFAKRPMVPHRCRMATQDGARSQWRSTRLREA